MQPGEFDERLELLLIALDNLDRAVASYVAQQAPQDLAAARSRIDRYSGEIRSHARALHGAAPH